MLELEAAQQRIHSALKPLGAESVPLALAPGRYLAESIRAAIDLPVFDNSAMDGYAVRAADVAAVSTDHSVMLRLIGEAAAGNPFEGELVAGTCVRVFTGSPLPRGADAVVMQEDARTDPAQPDFVSFLDAAKPGESVRRRGEDVASGTVLAEAGRRLTVGVVNLLAASGLSHVRVGKRPAAGVLATGNELQEAGAPLRPAHIYESNRIALAALLDQAGARPRIYPLVPDTLEATRQALDQALAENEVVLTSGGASVGELDFVKAAFQALGGQLEFWRVAMKPGKPFLFGRRGDRVLFGLPGNPASALVTFTVLVRPALQRLQGAGNLDLPASFGVLGETLTNPGDRRHFLRVRVDSQGNIWSAGIQASHALRSLAAADGLVDVPPRGALAAGSLVRMLQ